jgi:hypothetical protein
LQKLRNRKGNIQKSCQGLGEQGLATTGRANQEDVAFCKFDVVFVSFAGAILKTLVMVVDGDGQHLLGTLLADHVFVENCLDFLRFRQRVLTGLASILEFFADDVVTEFYAFVTDEYRGSRDELANFVLAFAAKRAIEEFAVLVLAAGVIAHTSYASVYQKSICYD